MRAATVARAPASSSISSTIRKAPRCRRRSRRSPEPRRRPLLRLHRRPGIELRRSAARCGGVMLRLSIIMPVLDEGEGIVAALDALADLRALGVEVIVVDGGSRDATVQRARLRADRVLTAPRGRAMQMNAGAEKATGDVLLFLHADTRLPAAAELVVLGGLERSGRAWGRFDVTIAGRHPLLAGVARPVNIRPSPPGHATGDQETFRQ